MRLQGVVTTGIYCRADCSARPDAKNVRPVPSGLAAMAAGFRPCLLCRPDRISGFGLGEGPGSSAPVEVAYAVRLIADGFLDEGSSESLAARIGYSTRQLNRLFVQHVGATPDFVARARRAHLARRLLDETQLRITDVALAAGFTSTRQMNRVVKRLFGFPPRHLRTRRRRKDLLPPTSELDGGLRLRIPIEGKFDVRRTFAYLEARAIRGVEAVQWGEGGPAYLRTTNTCGYPGVVELRPVSDGAQKRTRSGPTHLEATLHLATFGAILDQVSRARALFGLDAQLGPARRHLMRDPLLREIVRRNPGLRLLGAWDPFETAIRIVVGQQVSVAGASTVTSELAMAFGETPQASLPLDLCRLFPSPDALARAPLSAFSMPTARATAIRDFSFAVAKGEVDLLGRASLQACIAELTRIGGIGPWSAHLIAARCMRQPDAFPASDLGLRKGASHLMGSASLVSARELEALSQRWRPFRAHAAAYLWMALEARQRESQR